MGQKRKKWKIKTLQLAHKRDAESESFFCQNALTGVKIFERVTHILGLMAVLQLVLEKTPADFQQIRCTRLNTVRSC